MASYPPPIENLPIFNSLVFTDATTTASSGNSTTGVLSYYNYQIPQGVVVNSSSQTYFFPTMNAGTYFLFVNVSILTDEYDFIQYSLEVNVPTYATSPLFVRNYPYLNNNTTIGGYMPLSGQAIITLDI